MKPVVAIFAHPDDEAFGPAGTLAKFAKTRPVYLICVTDGAAGINSADPNRKLSDIRREELLASAKILGIKHVYFLEYKDGTLSSNLYHEVAEKIEHLLAEIRPEILLTYEPRGVTGHLDHIAVSFITSYVFEQSKEITELWLYCITEKRRESFKDYFIYFPPGYTPSEISKHIDVTEVWDQKMQALYEHKSQQHDIAFSLAGYLALPKEECFILSHK